MTIPDIEDQMLSLSKNNEEIEKTANKSSGDKQKFEGLDAIKYMQAHQNKGL